ncbi:hypothetical protein JCM5353_007708 [Sporobolomyces roseus]
MAPKKQQSKPEGGGEKKENSIKEGNKATASSNGDDECADMPPLEDMRKTDTAGGGKGQQGGGEKERNEGKAKIVARWSEGDAPMSLKFPPIKTIEIFKMLNIDPNVGDDKLYSILNEKTTKMLLEDRSEHGDLAESLGAILFIACMRTTTYSSPLFRLIRKIYTYEANQYLPQLKLPLPRGLSEYRVPRLMDVVYDESMSQETRDTLEGLQATRATDKARIDMAEKEAKELKGENGKMKTELVEYKAEVKEGFKARDEKASELEKVKTEKEAVKRELEKRDEENAKLKEELAKLRGEILSLFSLCIRSLTILACSASSSSSSSQVASSDKTSFVIKSLSRQVKDLGRQVKDKNDQLGESSLALRRFECC